MSSLTETAIFSRKAFIWIIIAICTVVALMILLGIGKNIKNALFPPKDLPATVAFGGINSLNKTTGFTAASGTTYELQTISGGFPALPAYGTVFEIKKGSSSFGAIDNVSEMASNIGFDGQGVEVAPGEFEYVDDVDKNIVLRIDSLSGNFLFDTNYENNTEILSGRPPDVQDAISIATRFLERYGLDLSDYPEEKVQTRMVRVDGTSLTPTQSANTANLIDVKFYRSDLNKVPVIWAKENEAPISVLVSERDVVYAKVSQNQIATNKFATYPLRNIADAYKDLEAGNGLFNRLPTQKQVTILNITLGYIESENMNGYLQPAYIFNSIDGLFGYVDAIESKWIEASQAANSL